MSNEEKLAKIREELGLSNDEEFTLETLEELTGNKGEEDNEQ